MPLQIRRGTAAERNALSSPLVIGELLYVTDQGKLYIGDGTSLGGPDIAGASNQGGKGLLISGFTSEEAQDATRDLFNNGTHSNITFNYDDSANSMSAVIDLASYNGNVTINGTITADAFRGDYKGSIFADDSSLMIDANNGLVVGPIDTSNIDVKTGLAGSSPVNIISALANPLTPPVLAFRRSRGTINSPTTTINGDVNLNIIGYGYDGTQFISSAGIFGQIDGAVSTGITPGRLAFVTTDTTGSFTTKVTIDNTGRLSVLGGGAEFFNLGSTSAGNSVIALRRTRGSITVPTVVSVNDQIFNLSASAYDGNTYTPAAVIGASVDSTVSSGIVPGLLYFGTANAAGSLATRLTIDSTGRTTALFGLSTDVNVADANAFSSLNSHTSTTLSSNINLRRSRGTTVAPATILSNDYLYNLNWQGFDGASFVTGVQLRGRAIGTVSTGNVQGQLQFRFRNTAGVLNTAIFADAENVEFRVPFGNPQIEIEENNINGLSSNEDIRINPSGTGTIDIVVPTQLTVGSAGAASALPATPSTYFKIKVDGVDYVVPAYAVA